MLGPAWAIFLNNTRLWISSDLLYHTQHYLKDYPPGYYKEKNRKQRHNSPRSTVYSPLSFTETKEMAKIQTRFTQVNVTLILCTTVNRPGTRILGDDVSRIVYKGNVSRDQIFTLTCSLNISLEENQGMDVYNSRQQVLGGSEMDYRHDRHNLPTI